jgi:Sulfotransferase domain
MPSFSQDANQVDCRVAITSSHDEYVPCITEIIPAMWRDRKPASKRWIVGRHAFLVLFLAFLSGTLNLSQFPSTAEERDYSPEISSLAKGMPQERPDRLLPTPILLVGMPKTGTSTIHAFFERSGYRSSHYKCTNGLYCGLCIRVAVEQGKPPLQTCGDYEVWAQMDFENLGNCHFPQITDLHALHQEAPHATMLLNLRNMTRWVRSVKHWVGGGQRSMAARLTKCKGGPKSKEAEDLIQWNNDHIQRIRDFVQKHPSHRLVEINIEDPRAGQIMELHFGAASPASNWGHENEGLQKNASRMTKSFP